MKPRGLFTVLLISIAACGGNAAPRVIQTRLEAASPPSAAENMGEATLIATDVTKVRVDGYDTTVLHSNGDVEMWRHRPSQKPVHGPIGKDAVDFSDRWVVGKDGTIGFLDRDFFRFFDRRAVLSVTDASAVAEHLGASWVCFLRQSGRVTCEENPALKPPIAIADLPPVETIDVRHDSSACGLTKDHALWCWSKFGYKATKQEGDIAAFTLAGTGRCTVTTKGIASCTRLQRDGEPAINFPYTDVRAIAVDVTSRFSICLIRASGAVLCTDGKTPMREISGVSSAASLSVGFEHACAVTEDRRALCWNVERNAR